MTTKTEEFAQLSFLDRAWFKIRSHPIGSVSLTWEERQALIKNIQEIETDLLQLRDIADALKKTNESWPIHHSAPGKT